MRWGYCFRDCWKKRVWASWLRTAPARAIEIATATWMKGCRKSVRNLVSFGALGEPANLEWRDSAEAAFLKKRRRLPEFSLMFLTGFLLGDPEAFPEKGSKDPALSGDSEAARP